MSPVGNIIGQHDVFFHVYADETQLRLSSNPKDLSSLSVLHNCLPGNMWESPPKPADEFKSQVTIPLSFVYLVFSWF